ncbi:MAG: hypothetical protein RIT32_363 [Actinomycetota bacterium]
MLLGLVLHSAVFTATYAPVRTELGQDLLYLIYDFIHAFRMPAFFFIAGFFAAMLFHKYGAGGLVLHRLKRVLLPLVIFWPLTVLAFQLIFAISTTGNVAPAEQDFIEFYHLWFLAYLLYVTVAAIVIVKLLPMVFLRSVKLLDYKFFQLVIYIVFTLSLAAIPFTLELDGTLKTASAVAPDNSMIVFYLIIFLLGWLAFQNKIMLTNYKKFWYLFLIVGLIGYFVHLATAEDLDFDYRVVYFGASLSLSFAILGIVLNLISGQSKLVSYISQSSYWIYIVHLPIVFLMLILLDEYQLTIGVRFLFVLIGTTVISVASYQFLVRGKPIGRLLGEKK